MEDTIYRHRVYISTWIRSASYDSFWIRICKLSRIYIFASIKGHNRTLLTNPLIHL